MNVALAAAFLVPRRSAGLCCAAALAAAVVLQAGRIIEAPAAKPDRAALLVQQNIPVSADWSPAYFQQTLSDLTQSHRQCCQQSAAKIDLIVWPESPAPFFTNDPRFREPVADLARALKTPVVAGSIGSDAPTPNSDAPVFNSAALVSPNGEWTARYDKVHLVPFGEYLPFPSLFSFAGGLDQGGRTIPARDLASSPGCRKRRGERKLGVFICYESIFPDEVRQFADNGAQVFVNISNDGWYGDSGAYAQHLNQTRMRAIENDRWLLSTTDTGVTASIDPWGRVVARIPRKERTTLVAPYALDFRHYSLHPAWRLVCVRMCDNFAGSAVRPLLVIFQIPEEG